MNLQYQITLHTWWHCGSGQSAGADVDLLVIKDSNGMPYIPGKTIKGLLREAAEELMCWQGDNEGKAKVDKNSNFVKVFGNFKDDKETMRKAESFFSNATIGPAEYEAIVARRLQHYLFNSIASTAIDKGGIADNGTLRKIEVTAPCILTGKIINVPDDMKGLLTDAANYIKSLGSGRNRGLGRCTFLANEESKESTKENQASSTKDDSEIMQFKVTLKSDVVLQQSSATQGSSKTLDYIPGASFMGIVASSLYTDMSDETYTLFHSGKVRFGDANPARNGHRCFRVPLAMYHPKFQKETESCFIHHNIKDFNVLSNLQLKQCRSGYFDFTDLTDSQSVKVNKEIALKSARDKNTRSSAKGQMFCYESLEKGTVLLMQVEAPTPDLRKKITECLVGTHRVGRSRSAQYGLIEIEKAEYKVPLCTPNLKEGDVVIYADSRLVFLDEYGLPTCQPEPKDFGINTEGAQIDWTRSQIRSFCYSPWNFKRQCFDADRFGIEKGSVIIVTGANESIAGPRCVGNFTTEGFGQILLNPDFLLSEPSTNGSSKAKLTTAEPKPEIKDNGQQTPLLEWLEAKQNQEQMEYNVYNEINKWVKEHKLRDFGGADLFKSQWGQIRSLAMEGGNKSNIISRIDNYLSHGVASKRWQKQGRRRLLIDFLNGTSFNNENIQMAVINLASQMAKP